MDAFTRYKFSDVDKWLMPFIEAERFFEYGSEPDLEHWLELSRLVLDAQQLFEIYLWNYSQLVNGLHIYANGVVCEVLDNGSQQSDLIRVNGYTMNYISSGINLVNFLSAWCTHERKWGFGSCEAFKKLTNVEFDNNLNYALAYSLRNYSQHGQLIVSMHKDNGIDKQICFDLYQLLNPMFVDMNAKAERRMEELLEFLENRQDGVIRLSYTCLIDSFHQSICHLYCDFLKMLHPYVGDCMEKAQSVLDNSNERVLFDNERGFFSILLSKQDEDYIAHLLIGKPEELASSLTANLETASKELAIAESNLEKTRKSFIPLSQE